jgi:sugar lactone lactonase YvrE
MGGAVYVADASTGYKAVRRVIDRMAFPNGIQLSPDGNGLYIAELSQNRDWRCTIDQSRVGISSCYVSTYFLSGMGPDGMKLDERGFIYQAHFNSQGVYVISPTPDNQIVEFIRVPAGRATTNLAFQPGTTWLYITEASQNAIWRVQVDAPGLVPWGLR